MRIVLGLHLLTALLRNLLAFLAVSSVTSMTTGTNLGSYYLMNGIVKSFESVGSFRSVLSNGGDSTSL